MRPLIFVRHSRVASAFLMKDLLELANIESGKARFPKKKGLQVSPEIEFVSGAGKGARPPAAKTIWERRWHQRCI
jgi:hypothetical protein